jgi:hypothetical protein
VHSARAAARARRPLPTRAGGRRLGARKRPGGRLFRQPAVLPSIPPPNPPPRGRAPRPRSPSSRTALAEAELEYPEGHRSRSIYVAMPLASAGAGVAPEAAAALDGAALAIWTTTPWTIPANLAVAVNDHLEYALVEAKVRRRRGEATAAAAGPKAKKEPGGGRRGFSRGGLMAGATLGTAARAPLGARPMASTNSLLYSN